MLKLSFVVPCFNEEEGIRDFYKETKKVFSQVNYDYEFIFIDDGSSDGTLKALKELKATFQDHIRIISFSRNFGKEAAIYAGLRASSGEYVSLIDADLQQRPEIVLQMVSILDENSEVDCVAAFQETRKENKLLSFYKNCFYKLINKMSETNFFKGASDFRTLRRHMVEAILNVNEYHRFSKGIFSWVGFNTHYISYQAEERAYGETKWRFWSLFKYSLEGIVSFTTVPLRIATFVGLFTSLAAFLYSIFVVFQKLFFSIDVPGFATLVIVILLLGGLQLLSIGIVGEYLARLYIQAKNRPIYITKENLYYTEANYEKYNYDYSKV